MICLQSGLVCVVQCEVLFTSQLNVFVILVSVTWAVRDKSLKVEILIFLRRSHLLGLVVPELLLGLALDLRHDELDVLGN